MWSRHCPNNLWRGNCSSRQNVRSHCGVGTAAPTKQKHLIGFPYPDLLELTDGKDVDPAYMVEMLHPLLYDGRPERIEKVVAQRTFSVLPIVEGIYNMGNFAAVCRTADGADKWLDVKIWEGGATECLKEVKAAGYQVLVAHMSKDSVPISEVDWTIPTAFVLGNEKNGVSAEAVAMADKCVMIPMVGFVESLNISVAASLIMYEAHNQRVKALGQNGDLTEDQKTKLQAVLMSRSLREAPTLLKELLNRPPRFWQAKTFKNSLQFDPRWSKEVPEKYK